MADFSKIDLYGTVYSVKDETARAKAGTVETSVNNLSNTVNQVSEKAQSALAKAEQSLNNDVAISYESASSTIKIVKANPAK